jgi:hypothetical protein
MRRLTKKRAGVLGGLIALAVGGAAFAYWTGATGSGTGTASTGTSTAALTVNQTGTLTAMYPGDSAQTLSGTFDNNAVGAGAAYVTSVTASIASVTKAGGAPAGTCAAADYTLSNPVMTVGAEVPKGAGVGTWTGATIQFHDTGTSQDACKGATVNLSYAIA